jgi:glycosyl transferase family 87
LLAWLIVLLPVAAATLAGAALRIPSLVSTLLVAYLALVAAMVGAVLILSPFREVTQGGLAAAEAVVLAGALAWWWARGRPGLPTTAARKAVREVLARPETALFLIGAIALLGYELLLAVTVPPNNWDSLTYHLARAAAWAQHGGVFWIQNAPTGRLNQSQPVAEQTILFLFAATKKSTLFALPQYTALLASLTAVYGTARRLGFQARPAACSAFLLASFSLVAFESTTAQNDLFAASFPAVAVCLLLGGSRTETLLAGAALGIGIGAKLTVAFVLPVVFALALVRGWRVLRLVVAGALGGLLIGGWGYAFNAWHAGSGFEGPGSVSQLLVSPAFPRSVKTVFQYLYRLLDISVLSHRLITELWIAALVAAALAAASGFRRGGLRRAGLQAAAVGVPLAAPIIVIGVAAVLAFATKEAHIPVHTSDFAGSVSRYANEDESAFGPVGALMLLGVPLLVAIRPGRTELRLLAASVPLFLIIFSLLSLFDPLDMRYFVVAAVLEAPVFAFVLGNRLAVSALLVVAVVTTYVSVTQERQKPYLSAAGHPWHMTQDQALGFVSDSSVAPAYADYEALVPTRACVGAVLGPDEPSYLLWGRNRTRKVFYLSSENTLQAVYGAGLYYVVISTRFEAPVADQFKGVGWTIHPLSSFWLLAVAPHPARAGQCGSAS